MTLLLFLGNSSVAFPFISPWKEKLRFEWMEQMNSIAVIFESRNSGEGAILNRVRFEFICFPIMHQVGFDRPEWTPPPPFFAVRVHRRHGNRAAPRHPRRSPRFSRCGSQRARGGEKKKSERARGVFSIPRVGVGDNVRMFTRACACVG